MQVVTFLTDINHQGFMSSLRPSCNYYNLDLTILSEQGSYTSHRVKDRNLHKFLEDLSSEEIILFVDGHDTIFLAGENEILEKYTRFNSPLVFSAEINCWPAKELMAKYPNSNHHFKYLNCGGFIGRAGFIRDLYRTYHSGSLELDASFVWSNQYFWHHVYLANTKSIKIDHNCEIFYNASPLMELVTGLDLRNMPHIENLLRMEKQRFDKEMFFSNKRVRCNVTETFPCHLHLPGPLWKIIMRGNYFDRIKPWLD